MTSHDIRKKSPISTFTSAAKFPRFFLQLKVLENASEFYVS